MSMMKTPVVLTSKFCTQSVLQAVRLYCPYVPAGIFTSPVPSLRLSVYKSVRSTVFETSYTVYRKEDDLSVL